MRRLGGPIARTACALTIVVACAGGLATRATAAPPSPIGGYWSVDSLGHVHASGDAPHLRDLRGVHLNAPIVGIAATPTGRGYWLAAADGGVFAFGDAHFYGSAGAIHLNQPIVGIAATQTGHGYLLVASDGGVFTYGDARFSGSAGAIHLNQPIVGVAATQTGRGYRLVASDGGVFTYGDATFGGSAGALPLNAPIVGIATVGARGYRLAAADGGVFTYGGASYSGALTGTAFVTGIATGPFGGYVLRDATHWTLPAFGNASNCSETAADQHDPAPAQPFVGVAVAFNPSDPRVESGIATGACSAGADTGTFRAPARWHIDVGSAPGSCTVNVIPRDPGPPAKRSLSFSSRALPTQIQMRSTQMNGHSVFEVEVNGPCDTVVVSSLFHPRSPPLEIFNRGDSAPFSSPNPITIQPDCLTEVRADNDGHLVQPQTAATIHLPAGAYWLTNDEFGCVVKIT